MFEIVFRLAITAVILAVVLGALSGCGRKGKLQPPPASTSMVAPAPAQAARAG